MSINSTKEFLDRLTALGDDLRRTIELECEAFSPDPNQSNNRKQQAHRDFGFFCETYFPHYIRSPHRSSFQQAVIVDLPLAIDDKADAREVFLAPRGEAKSTFITQLGSLWLICTERKKFGVVLMDSQEQAMEMLEAIKAELDSNPRLALDFSKATGQGRVWQASTIITANNIKVRAGGTGKRIRGMRHGAYRPDWVILDDLENDQNVRQKTQRDKTERWVLSAVSNLGPPDGGMDVFYVGTSLHYDAAINRIGRAPGWTMQKFRAIEKWPDNLSLWDKWENILKIEGNTNAERFYRQNKVGLEQGAVVSWPEVRPLKRLMELRAANHDEFEREYQNTPGNDDSAPFKNIQFWTEKRNDWVYFGALDPSLGKSASNRDPSAILIGGFCKETRILDVVEAEIARRVPDHIISRVIELQKQYTCIAWGIETVQFQEFLFSELVKRSSAAGIPVPGVSIKTSTDKAMRIISLQPPISNGLIRLHHNLKTLIEQLRFWPEADHDDGPDALEMLWQIAKQYSQEFSYTPVTSGRGLFRRAWHALSGNTEGWDD